MRWSATREAPWSRSSASPLTRSALRSIRSIWLTTPPHWSAKAADEPTSPPPPMMLTFIPVAPLSLISRRALSGRPVQRLHDLVGDRPDEGLCVGPADGGMPVARWLRGGPGGRCRGVRPPRLLDGGRRRRQEALDGRLVGHAAGDLGMDEDAGLRRRLVISFAEEAVAAQVAVLQAALQSRVGDPETRLEADQLGGLVVAVVMDPAELLARIRMRQ